MNTPAPIDVVEIVCPLCEAKEYRSVCSVADATYGMPGEYLVVRCSGCDHLYLNPRPSDEALMACYPQTYAPHLLPEQTCDPSEADSTPRKKTMIRRRLAAIPGVRKFLFWLGQEDATYLPPPALAGISRMLEVGCAQGRFLKRAAALGWIADGVEPSLAAVKRARQSGLEVFCGKLSDAALPSGSRELVVMWMVLEHVPNPRELLAECFRILQPGGQLALSVPNAGGWERKLFGRHWLGYDAPRHLQMFTSQRLKQLLQEEGFIETRILHQSNTRYWWGSFAAWGRARFPQHRWPARWMEYFRLEPPSAWRWILLVPGKGMSLLGLAGRITVICRKAE